MGSVSVPTLMIIAMAGTAVASGAAAYESHEAGIATSNQAKQKARIEADSEKNKQIAMRQNMLRALASQNAAAGAGGGGASKANSLRQINQAQNDIMVSQTNSAAQVSLLDSEGASARAQGNIGAVVDLASGTSTIAADRT
jgi:hypothetical protein